MLENIIVGIIAVLVIAVGIGAWWYENYGPNEDLDDTGNTINMDNKK